jgi:hypothetical protein
MINFNFLEHNVASLHRQFLDADPIEHIVIDGFCDSLKLRDALSLLPDPDAINTNKSRDYIFAKNKFEKADFDLLCPAFAELKVDLLSSRFESWVSALTGQKIFIDPNFHGGGIHQGGEGSFLDMHVDFNYHPESPSWFRNINILIYLNEDWQEAYSGQLKLADGRKNNPTPTLIEPLFNRAVIMFTRDYTLHGYDPISFPKGKFRRSIAAYGYTQMEQAGTVRTTVWYPEKGGVIKQFLGRHMPKFVRIKSALLGSGTNKNK